MPIPKSRSRCCAREAGRRRGWRALRTGADDGGGDEKNEETRRGDTGATSTDHVSDLRPQVSTPASPTRTRPSTAGKITSTTTSASWPRARTLPRAVRLEDLSQAPRHIEANHAGWQFWLAYRSLCPSGWYTRWDEQRGERTYLAKWHDRVTNTSSRGRQLPCPSGVREGCGLDGEEGVEARVSLGTWCTRIDGRGALHIEIGLLVAHENIMHCGTSSLT